MIVQKQNKKNKDINIRIIFMFLSFYLLSFFAQENEKDSITNLSEVEIIAPYFKNEDFTPVTTSRISSAEIQKTLVARELPYVLQTVPSLYVRQSSRGENSSQIFLRGFDQSSIGLLLNGIPISDMEYGRVFWSQWGMLPLFAHQIEIQKGLGASRMIINSVGGSINILTLSPENSPSADAEFSYGSQNNLQTIVKGNSGNLQGWKIGAGFGYQQSDGYNEGTAMKNYFYWTSISKIIQRHQINLTILGSATESGNRYDWGSEVLYENAPPTVNPYGNTSDKSYRKAHLPFIALNHQWQISENMRWHNAIYLTSRSSKSVSPEASIKSLEDLLLQPDQTWNYYQFVDGFGLVNPLYANGNHIDFDKIQAYNSGQKNPWTTIFKDNEDARAAFILKAAHNNYHWFGGISSFSWDFSPNLQWHSGTDLRYYTADHYHTLDNLLGANYYLDLNPYVQGYVPNNINQDPMQKMKEKDRIDYAYKVNMYSVGIFNQLVYQYEKFNSFLSFAVSNTGYQSHYLTQFHTGDKNSITSWYHKWGVNTRLGLSYQLNDVNYFYTNGGFFSKAPYIDIVFINNGLTYNKASKNEKIYATELGYVLKIQNLSLQTNLYYTYWTDRARDITNHYEGKNYRGFVYNSSQEHYGFELESRYIPTRFADLRWSISLGDWRFANNPSGNLYADDNAHIPLPSTVYIKGLKVPNAPQLSTYFSLTSYLYRGFYVGANISYFDQIYADLNANVYNDPDKKQQMWRLPAYYLLDIQMGYSGISLGGGTLLSLSLQTLNVTNQLYIAEATDGLNHDRGTSGYFYGNGITYLVTAKIHWQK